MTTADLISIAVVVAVLMVSLLKDGKKSKKNPLPPKPRMWDKTD